MVLITEMHDVRMMRVVRIDAGIIHLFLISVSRDGDSWGVVKLLFMRGCVGYADGGVVGAFRFVCFCFIWCRSMFFK